MPSSCNPQALPATVKVGTQRSSVPRASAVITSDKYLQVVLPVALKAAKRSTAVLSCSPGARVIALLQVLQVCCSLSQSPAIKSSCIVVCCNKYKVKCRH